MLTEVFYSDMIERARGVPPFVSAYIFVLGYLLFAFNHKRLVTFSAFSLTNIKHII